MSLCAEGTRAGSGESGLRLHNTHKYPPTVCLCARRGGTQKLGLVWGLCASLLNRRVVVTSSSTLESRELVVDADVVYVRGTTITDEAHGEVGAQTTTIRR